MTNEIRLDVQVRITNPDGSWHIGSVYQYFDPAGIPIAQIKTTDFSAVVCNGIIREMQKQNLLARNMRAELVKVDDIDWSAAAQKKFSKGKMDANERFGDDEI